MVTISSSSAPSSPVQESSVPATSIEEESPNIFYPKPTNVGAALAQINEGKIGQAPVFNDNWTSDAHMDRLVPSQYPEIKPLVPT